MNNYSLPPSTPHISRKGRDDKMKRAFSVREKARFASRFGLFRDAIKAESGDGSDFNSR